MTKAIEAAEAQFLDAMAASARKLERLERQRDLATIRAMIAASTPHDDGGE